VVLTAVMVVAVGGAAAKPTPPIAASSNLCKGKTFKIGYDVFSSTQPFANLVTKGLKDAAKRTGCVTVITTVDNLNGPVAVGNVKTMLNEGANGIIDFNVLAVYQPAIAKLVKQAGIPADAIVGANLPGYPAIGADNYGASVINGRSWRRRGRRSSGARSHTWSSPPSRRPARSSCSDTPALLPERSRSTRTYRVTTSSR
jgi:ABC-type sugar transport system substrate-binding protein